MRGKGLHIQSHLDPKKIREADKLDFPIYLYNRTCPKWLLNNWTTIYWKREDQNIPKLIILSTQIGITVLASKQKLRLFFRNFLDLPPLATTIQDTRVFVI